MKIEFALMEDAVAEVEVDQALVGQPDFGGHGLEIGDGLMV